MMNSKENIMKNIYDCSKYIEIKKIKMKMKINIED